jgi:hypothetical protein
MTLMVRSHVTKCILSEIALGEECRRFFDFVFYLERCILGTQLRQMENPETFVLTVIRY